MKVTECAVISSKTRESAESIGTSINAMLSRISRITQTGFNEDDDTKLNDVAKALNTVGIALTNQTGNFRDFGTILDEIAVKWNTLDDQTQSYIANTIGGVRQQSRFFNLMNGYAESMTLYEQSLEAAGTAQSKFNLYLESNRATLDNFRTTLEGLWITIIDSDSLMNIVRAGTSFIELLDSMIDSFGLLGSAATILIPLIGVRYVASVTSATKAMIAQELAGKAIGNSNISLMNGFKLLIGQLFGAKVAADGATVSFMGLNAAAGILGIALVAIPMVLTKIAQKSRETKEAFANALDNSQKVNDEVKLLDSLVKKQEELIGIEDKSVEQKEELIKVQKELAQLYPELATGIDDEGNAIAENLEMTKQLTEEKRKLLEQELLVIKTTADTRLPQLRKELADMQDEAQRIQDRLSSGDVYETLSVDGYEYQIDKTEELKNRLLELVDAQKENHEETTKLESGVNSYNQILEENAERHKWLTAETLALEVAMDDSQKNIERVERELKKLGFTSEDTANIISGNIDLVKEKYKELDMQQIINLQTIENLDATQKQAMTNMLENSRQATKQLIQDTKARITAIKAEMTALSALAGGKVKNVSIVSKKNELDPKSGLLSNLSTIAQNEAIDAQIELSKLEGSLREIDKALTNVSNISTEQISGIKDPKKDSKKDPKKGSSSTKEEYKAIYDIYTKINLELDKNNVLLQKNKTLQDLAGDDLTKRIELMEKEIELNKERQGLLHDLNEEMRARGKELQSELSGIFNFEGSWDDNSITITNLDKIDGKSKAIEDKYKEILSIIKDLPGASQEWWNIQLANEKSAEAMRQLQKQRLSDRLANSKDWIEKRKFYDDWGADNEIAAWERVKAYIQDYYDQGIINHKEYTDYMLEIDRNLESARQDLINQREKLRQEWITKENGLYQDQQDRLSALDSIQEKIVQIIRKRGEEEKKVLDESHKAEMDSLEERHKERKKLYQEELDEFKKLIQGKIDALDEQYDEEDYLEQLNKEREEATRLQGEIDVLSLDDSLTARNKTIELRKQLADQNDKIAKIQQKKERDTLRKSLQDQLKDKESDMKNKEKIADNIYENEKKRLEEDYRINKEFLERKYSDEQVYSEARKSIMRGQVEVAEGVFMDIYDAFSDFEDKFGKGMGILGDIIRNDFTRELEKAQQAIRDLEYESRNRLSQYDSNYDPGDDAIGWREPTREPKRETSRPKETSKPKTIKDYSDAYFKARDDGDWKAMEYANRQANILRGLGNVVTSQVDIDAVKKKYGGSFKHGAEVMSSGLMLTEFHGTKDDPEWILNSDQLKKVLESTILSTIKITTPKIPTGALSKGVTLQIDNLINVEGNVTKETIPQIKTAGNEIMTNLQKALNKNGVFRPVKS